MFMTRLNILGGLPHPFMLLV